MTLDAGEHRFVTGIFVNGRQQCRMAGEAVARASKKGERHKGE